jgi:hypothetical protein
MWSYADQQAYFQSMAQSSNAAHLALGYKNINMGNKKLETMMGMPPMQEERTFSTLTSTNQYPLPERFIKMDELYVTVSSQRWYADPEYSEDAWRGYMRRPNAVVSDQLTNVFVRPGIHKFEIFPIAATAGNTMTMLYSAFSKDLSAADYTTGTITTLANGGTTVTFSGTTLTQLMVGRWLKTDDGNWYKIATITDATHAVLLMPYQGTAIALGTSTFVIGELPRTPEGTHEIAVNYALWMHFLGAKRDAAMAAYFKTLWTEGSQWAKDEFGSRYASAVIPSQRRKLRSRPKDPNNYPDLSGL